MEHSEVKITDMSSKWHVRLPVKMPADVVHWLREHSVKDLKMLLLEMHSAGEDISEYVPVLEELECEEKKLRLSGVLHENDEDTDPLEYVDVEMKAAFS